MRDEPPPQPEDDELYVEPGFNFRRGLKWLLIVGITAAVITMICISLDSRY
jgi:hypothetical protein